MEAAPVWHERITSRPDVLTGKPCIDGTRVSVEAVLDTLSVIGSIAETAAAFPRVREADVRAALAYAADALRNDDLEFLVRRR
jgi:uncharacterized protein (DUF433 family)